MCETPSTTVGLWSAKGLSDVSGHARSVMVADQHGAIRCHLQGRILKISDVYAGSATSAVERGFQSWSRYCLMV